MADEGGYGIHVIAVGEDLGNGFCVVSHEWLPTKVYKLAEQNGLVYNGKCIISSAFINNCWHADAVYDWEYKEYRAG